MKYKLITVEGNTGAGKTSLAKMLTQEYQAKLILEEFADNPFLPKFYKEPKQYAFTTELYFMADRYQQLSQLLSNNELDKKEVFITDYLFNKSLLYAEVTLEADEFQLFARLFNLIYSRIPKPDLIVYVHSTIDRLVQNIQKRGRDFEQSVRREYLQQVENIYFNYFKENANLRILILEADEIDFVHNEQHYQQILAHLEKEYEPGMHFIKFDI